MPRSGRQRRKFGPWRIPWNWWTIETKRTGKASTKSQSLVSPNCKSVYPVNQNAWSLPVHLKLQKKIKFLYKSFSFFLLKMMLKFFFKYSIYNGSKIESYLRKELRNVHTSSTCSVIYTEQSLEFVVGQLFFNFIQIISSEVKELLIPSPPKLPLHEPVITKVKKNLPPQN